MARVGRSMAIGLALIGSLWVVAPAAAQSDMCVAANGEVRMDRGGAECTAEGTGSVARVRGEDSTATADGEHNRATVSGDGSFARADAPEGCTAEVVGDNQSDTTCR